MYLIQVGGARWEEAREGGRRLVEEKEFFFIFRFFFLSLHLSLCRLGPFNRKLVKKRTQAALETMPSDNEEQPVDAKTIAELTEQV